MFARLTITLLAALAFSTSGAADYSVVRQYVYPALVAAEATGKINSTGSAVAIAEGYLLTVEHLVPNRKQTLYVDYNGPKLATVIKTDATLDLALIAAPVKCPCAPISSIFKVSVDQTAYAVGFPFYSDYRIQVVSPGIIQGTHQSTLLVTSSTGPGGSGGGMFVLEGKVYKLYGIVKGVPVVDIGGLTTINQQQNWMVLSTNAEAIRAFLKGTPAAPATSVVVTPPKVKGP